jgi:hypothetical protein
MGLLRKLFGGGGDGHPAAAHDPGLKEFLAQGSVQPGTPEPGDDSPAKRAVTDEDVAAAFGAEVVGRELAIDDGDVVQLDFRLRDSDGTLSVFVCDHRGRPGMAQGDESCWRDTGVERELRGLGDSAFVNKEGTFFARLADRWTIQIPPPGNDGATVDNVGRGRALAASILDRLAAGG